MSGGLIPDLFGRSTCSHSAGFFLIKSEMVGQAFSWEAPLPLVYGRGGWLPLLLRCNLKPWESLSSVILSFPPALALLLLLLTQPAISMRGSPNTPCPAEGFFLLQQSFSCLLLVWQSCSWFIYLVNKRAQISVYDHVTHTYYFTCILIII